MKTLINTFLETSNERLKNPLIGTFIFSWLAINWKPISVFIFSPESIYQRIDIIEQCYSSIWLNLFLPLIVAIIYLLVLPYIMWCFDLIVNLAIKKRKQNLINLQLSELVGKKELATKESEIEDIKANQLEKHELNKKINNLNKSISEKNFQIEKLESETMELKKNSNKEDSTTPKRVNLNIKDPKKHSQILNFILKDNEKSKLFNLMIESIINDNWFELTQSNRDNVNYFLKADLISLISKHSNNANFRKYDFTELGNKIKEKYLDKTLYNTV